MLRLVNVTKTYDMGEYRVNALRGVSLAFRECEFVSIIGASGCGKSTMLNIIGGLDRYTTGDLIIGDTSTKEFKDEQWDAYRNATIGFIFQSYNLIPHLTVLENVALALSLSGVDKAERNRRSIEALEKVGLGDELKKKPSQLSGGQMQRVAIARALVNNPKIVLADEPTGALDSELSVQVMEVLKEVAKDRLVIMVTHNNELANEYSTRIVRLKDGHVEYDTMPYSLEEEAAEYATKEDSAGSSAPVENDTVENTKKSRSPVDFLNKLGIGGGKKKKCKGKSPFKATSMKAKTAFSLSFKNLTTKKRRTFLTSFAGSIGIISLALVLAMSNGFNVFIDSMQTTILATVPISVYEYSIDYTVMTDMFENYADEVTPGEYPDEKVAYIQGTGASATSDGISSLLGTIQNSISTNDISPEFVNYLGQMDKSLCKALNMYYGVSMNVLTKSLNDDGDTVYGKAALKNEATTALTIASQVLGDNGLQTKNWYQLVGDENFVLEYYDLIDGSYPKSKEEVVLVVDGNNSISAEALKLFGFDVYERDENGKVVHSENGNRYYKDEISFEDIYKQELKLVHNNDYYTQDPDNESHYVENTVDEELFNNDSNLTLKVVGVLRSKPKASVATLGTALCYTPALAKYVVENAHESEVAKAQAELLKNEETKDQCVIDLGGTDHYNLPQDASITKDSSALLGITGFATNGLQRTRVLKALGVDTTPVYINIYPTNFDTKSQITDYVDAWNENGGDINYFDVSEMFIHNMRTIVDLMTYVLLGMASISLIVSSVMISIITGNSVVERTREIGILRSLGARKRDISRVFDAETSILGLYSGLLGIGIAYALVPFANFLIERNAGVSGLMVLSPLHAVLLVILSLTLTVISGLVPSQVAAHKNVVDALRIE